MSGEKADVGLGARPNECEGCEKCEGCKVASFGLNGEAVAAEAAGDSLPPCAAVIAWPSCPLAQATSSDCNRAACVGSWAWLGSLAATVGPTAGCMRAVRWV